MSLPSPVEMLDIQVARRSGRNLFSSARGSLLMPVAIKSSMVKGSLFRRGCRLAVLSSRDKLLSLKNFHVCKIQEWVVHVDREGSLFEKIFTEQPISILWYSMRSLR